MVIWAQPAKADLHHIFKFIAEGSKHYAWKVTREIVEKTDILDQLPNMGKVVPEIRDDNVRELHLYSYRILYEIKTPNVEVLAIIHKRRDFKADDLAR